MAIINGLGSADRKFTLFEGFFAKQGKQPLPGGSKVYPIRRFFAEKGKQPPSGRQKVYPIRRFFAKQSKQPLPGGSKVYPIRRFFAKQGKRSGFGGSKVYPIRRFFAEQGKLSIVGKTFLINEYFDNDFAFKITGAYKQDRAFQLDNFAKELRRKAKGEWKTPDSWAEAFEYLREYLESLGSRIQSMVTLDDLFAK